MPGVQKAVHPPEEGAAWYQQHNQDQHPLDGREDPLDRQQPPGQGGPGGVLLLDLAAEEEVDQPLRAGAEERHGHREDQQGVNPQELRGDQPRRPLFCPGLVEQETHEKNKNDPAKIIEQEIPDGEAQGAVEIVRAGVRLRRVGIVGGE